MKKADFIKKIIDFFGMAVLPVNMFRQYHRLYLLQCFVRGFRYYDGPQLLNQMQQGDLLELVREHGNPHDSCAIALHFNQHKIGYIPAEQNEILSRLLDAGVVELLAEITRLEPEAATWENVHAAVYVLKEDAVAEQAAYLAMLETPRYYTLKHAGNRITRIASEGRELPDGNAFYNTLAENRDTAELQELVPDDDSGPQAMEAMVNESLLLVNRHHLPADLQGDEVMMALEEGMVALDHAFDEKGYVVAGLSRLAELSARIDHFVLVKDRKGKLFWEVVFGGKQQSRPKSGLL